MLQCIGNRVQASGISRGMNQAPNPKNLAMFLVGWQSGTVVSGVRHMNKVNTRWTRLVPGWVTIFGQVHHLGM